MFAGPETGADASPTFRALVPADVPGGTGSAYFVAYYDPSGNLTAIPGTTVDSATGGINADLTEQPDNVGGGTTASRMNVNFDPLQNSPDDNWNIVSIAANMDVNSSGFTQGTNGGDCVNVHNLNIQHHGTGDTGGLGLTSNYFDIGNGSDPINVRGLAYSYGFGDINSGVTLSGQIQGHGFQPNIHAGAILQQGIQAFYDFGNSSVEVPGYNSFNAGPQIASIANNSNYVAFNTNASIPLFNGNAGFVGLAVSPSLGTINHDGNFQGASVSPNITLNKGNAIGLNINMNNITNYAGAQSTLVVQDITYTFHDFSANNNSLTLQYVNDVTAGGEFFAITGGNTIVGHIQSGVSTATQVRAAAVANVSLNGAITVTITGTASNAQVATSAANFAGGEDPGRKKAAQFDGDVSINGSLQFSGSLAIGQLSSFATEAVPTGAGVHSIDTLITSPTVAANATISGTDLLAINTAMLLTIGDNATVTSSFLGYAALGLPAVVSMGTGSTIDLVEGAVFAISLDSGATGGAIAEVDLCRSLAIPNGVTSVTRLKAYEFDLPFGDPGATTWGVYMAPTTAQNFMGGSLKVGGTDTVSNSSVGIEVGGVTQAIRNSNMTTIQKLALTPLAGMMVFDTTLSKLSYYNGIIWVNV